MAGETDRAARIANLLSRADGNIDEKLKERQAKDRSYISYLIVGAFVVAIIIMFVFVLMSAGDAKSCTSAPCPPAAWEKPAEFLFKVLSSVLLPVVTLVLGYYFGTEKAKE